MNSKLICIECKAEFDTLDQAWKHMNPLASNDARGGAVRIPLKKHVVFPKLVRQDATAH